MARRLAQGGWLAWGRNPYYQAFCGMEHFQWQFPCDPSELVHFHKRIGESGVEKIFQASVLFHGEQALEREVVIDTTVQEKSITFPTDTKLRVKVMGRCWKLAAEENMRLRRSYRRESRKVLRVMRFSKSTKDKKNDFRLARNYLKGTIGDAINLLLAAAAFNCRKWM